MKRDESVCDYSNHNHTLSLSLPERRVPYFYFNRCVQFDDWLPALLKHPSESRNGTPESLRTDISESYSPMELVERIRCPHFVTFKLLAEEAMQSCMSFTEKIVVAKISANVMHTIKVMQFIY